VQTILYRAVIQTKEAPLDVAPYVLWGEVTPCAIAQLYSSVLRVAQVEGQGLTLDITLTGEGKECVAKQLAGTLIGLARQGIHVRVA
jgi:hypothetical protein